MFIVLLIHVVLLSQVAVGTFAGDADNVGCPNRVFIGCVLRLKAQRVPFEKNILNVIFNIGSEARLMHTCKAYSEIMPCFRDKILECGNDKQRRMLNEVGKTLMFLCSPFSVERQRLLMKHQKCIGEILALPATVGCKLHDSYHGKQLLKCREVCSNKPTDFTCMLKTWISEQNVCTLRDIHDKCGAEASSFYTDLQSNVFEPLFPVLCDFPSEVTAMPQVALTEVPLLTSPNTGSSVVALPVNRNMIQPPRIRPISRVPVKHKPVEGRPIQWNSVPETTVSIPDQKAIVWHHSPASAKYGYTVTAKPLPPVEQHPLMSLFSKILPNAIPSGLNNLFQGSGFMGPENGGPIAAKENFELNSITIAVPTTTTDVFPTTTTTMSTTTAFVTTTSSPTTPGTTTTTTAVSTTTDVPERPLPARERFTSVTQPPTATIPSLSTTGIYSFTTKPRSQSEHNGLWQTSEKWRPWYLGGFSQVKSDDKFRMPLYHGM